jgi:hypothetical protein
MWEWLFPRNRRGESPGSSVAPELKMRQEIDVRFESDDFMRKRKGHPRFGAM